MIENINIVTLEQRTADWMRARTGRVTASRVADALAKLKRKEGEAAARANYKTQLVIETITGDLTDHYVSPAMTWGIETEPLARAAYEIETGSEVELIGFVQHPTIERLGCSPDGLVGSDGLVEFKCPDTTTYLNWLIAGVVPEEHKPQLLCQLACCPERAWVDFCAHDPRLPSYLQTFIVRFPRTKETQQEISVMELEVVQFLREIDELIERLPKPEAAEVRG